MTQSKNLPDSCVMSIFNSNLRPSWLNSVGASWPSRSLWPTVNVAAIIPSWHCSKHLDMLLCPVSRWLGFTQRLWTRTRCKCVPDIPICSQSSDLETIFMGLADTKTRAKKKVHSIFNFQKNFIEPNSQNWCTPRCVSNSNEDVTITKPQRNSTLWVYLFITR